MRTPFAAASTLFQAVSARSSACFRAHDTDSAFGGPDGRIDALFNFTAASAGHRFNPATGRSGGRSASGDGANTTSAYRPVAQDRTAASPDAPDHMTEPIPPNRSPLTQLVLPSRAAIKQVWQRWCRVCRRCAASSRHRNRRSHRKCP